MHNSVTQDFDRVSDFNDNGLTPLQGQQDEQPEGVKRAENAIDNDVVDIISGGFRISCLGGVLSCWGVANL